MYTLLYITTMAFMGTYADQASCQNAIREVYTVQLNPPGQRLLELNESINLRLATQRVFVCVPVKKG
jgi:hypothetical protein